MSDVCAPAGKRSGILLSTEHGTDIVTVQDTVRVPVTAASNGCGRRAAVGDAAFV